MGVKEMEDGWGLRKKRLGKGNTWGFLGASFCLVCINFDKIKCRPQNGIQNDVHINVADPESLNDYSVGALSVSPKIVGGYTIT